MRPSRQYKSNIFSRRDRVFLKINITLERGTKQIKGFLPVSRHLHSIEVLISGRLEELFNSSRSTSVNRRVLLCKGHTKNKCRKCW